MGVQIFAPLYAISWKSKPSERQLSKLFAVLKKCGEAAQQQVHNTCPNTGACHLHLWSYSLPQTSGWAHTANPLQGFLAALVIELVVVQSLSCIRFWVQR